MIHGPRHDRPVRGRAVAAGLAALALAAVAPAATGQPTARAPAAAAAAAPAGARFGQPGAPLDVSADNTEVLQAENKSILIGRVEIVQGQSRMRAPRVVLFFNKNNGVKGGAPGAASPGPISRMEADGPVYFVTPTQTAKGDRGIYEAETETITLIGNVVVTQDKNVSTGDKLVIQQRTNQITMSGGPSTSGRVRGVFYTNDKPAPPATQP